MFEYLPNQFDFLKSNTAYLDAVALYGYNPTAHNLARLFSSVGLRVYILSSNSNDERSLLSSAANVTFVNDAHELPYLSSVLINCQNDLLPIKYLINSFPNEYKQRMAYVECSSFIHKNQLELFCGEMKFTHYLCMNIIELDTSTMIQPHLHLVSSGDKIVYEKLLLQTNLPAKITFLNQTKTPWDAFYICLFHRYSQAVHLAIYAEMLGVLRAANPIYPGNLQLLFDWSYVKTPIMRQMILQSASSSFTFSTINDVQSLLECIIDCFYQNPFNDHKPNHLKSITYKLHQFISNLDTKQKEKPFFQLFTLY